MAAGASRHEAAHGANEAAGGEEMGQRRPLIGCSPVLATRTPPSPVAAARGVGRASSFPSAGHGAMGGGTARAQPGGQRSPWGRRSPAAPISGRLPPPPLAPHPAALLRLAAPPLRLSPFPPSPMSPACPSLLCGVPRPPVGRTAGADHDDDATRPPVRCLPPCPCPYRAPWNSRQPLVTSRVIAEAGPTRRCGE